MNRTNIIIGILLVIVIGLVIYTGYLFEENMNSDNIPIINESQKNTTTINESDPNGTNAEITAEDIDYQSYSNQYGG